MCSSFIGGSLEQAVVGDTNSTDFPLADSVQEVFQGGEADSFVAEYSLGSASSSGRPVKDRRPKRR